MKNFFEEEAEEGLRDLDRNKKIKECAFVEKAIEQLKFSCQNVLKQKDTIYSMFEREEIDPNGKVEKLLRYRLSPETMLGKLYSGVCSEYSHGLNGICKPCLFSRQRLLYAISKREFGCDSYKMSQCPVCESAVTKI